MGGNQTQVTPSSSADGASHHHQHHHHHRRQHHHEHLAHPAGKPRAKTPRAQLQRLLTQGPMQLDLAHHQSTDRTSNAHGDRAIIDVIMKQVMQQRNTCSQLRTQREAKARKLADLKVQMAEVDPQGEVAAAALAQIEPLGMRRELLQYRLSELAQQMFEISEEGRVQHHIMLRAKAQHQQTVDGVEALQREKVDIFDEEHRMKEALASAQQLSDHTFAAQAKLNAGYWAQHEFWKLEIERCAEFLSKTTAESAREKAFVLEQKKARGRRLLMKREQVINTRRYQLAVDTATTAGGDEGMSKAARKLRELQQTTGLTDAQEVIDAFFTLTAFIVTMGEKVEELREKARKLELERSELIAVRSADQNHLGQPAADQTAPASQEPQEIALEPQQQADSGNSNASSVADDPAPQEQQETRLEIADLPRGGYSVESVASDATDTPDGDCVLDGDYGSATVRTGPSSPSALSRAMSARDIRDLDSVRLTSTCSLATHFLIQI